MKGWLLLAAILLAAAAAWFAYQWNQKRDTEPVQPQKEISTPVAAAPEPPQRSEPADREAEPETPSYTPPPAVEPSPMTPAESDAAVRDSLAEEMDSSFLREIIPGDDLVSRAVASVDGLSARQVSTQILPIEGPGGEFEATADQRPEEIIRNDEGDPIPQYVLDPVNYQRYSGYVDAFVSVSAEQWTQWLRSYETEIQAAWKEQGYPDQRFEDRLIQVIDHLLAAPEVSDPIRLIKPEAFYQFADPGLEALSAGQKMLIRIGPEHSRRVREQLRAIRQQLSS